MPLKRPLLAAIALAATLILPAGCAGASHGSFCSIYRPVYTADGDTEKTREQADINNAVWLEMCSRKESQ